MEETIKTSEYSRERYINDLFFSLISTTVTFLMEKNALIRLFHTAASILTSTGKGDKKCVLDFS